MGRSCLIRRATCEPARTPDAARQNGRMPPDQIDAFLARTRFNDDGLVPAIAQQWDSREVLMMAWMTR